MSHHRQTALITPTSLIKDTHLFWCMCVQDEYAIQTMLPSPIPVNARKLLHNIAINCNKKWKKLGLIISQLFTV